MHGTITRTNGYGGLIRPDDGGPLIPFAWADCADIGPNDVGHGVAVQFYIEVVSGRERAIAVRRRGAVLIQTK